MMVNYGCMNVRSVMIGRLSSDEFPLTTHCRRELLKTPGDQYQSHI